MLVSVIMPMFNAGATISWQMEALASQTFKGAWELIVVDNGSTDSSRDIVGAYSSRLNVRIVSATERRGASYARNSGARCSRAEFLAFVDADDVVEANWLDVIYSYRAAADLITGGIDVGRLNSKEVVYARGASTVWDELPAGPCKFRAFARSGNLLIARSRFWELDGFDETMTFCEDVDFSWRAQERGMAVAVAPDAVVNYRFRGTPIEVLRQMANYEGAEACLYRRYRARGARRRSLGEVLDRYFWVASRSPYVFMDGRRRYLWCTIAGGLVGRVHGSYRHRVLYL